MRFSDSSVVSGETLIWLDTIVCPATNYNDTVNPACAGAPWSDNTDDEPTTFIYMKMTVASYVQCLTEIVQYSDTSTPALSFFPGWSVNLSFTGSFDMEWLNPDTLEPVSGTFDVDMTIDETYCPMFVPSYLGNVVNTDPSEFPEFTPGVCNNLALYVSVGDTATQCYQTGDSPTALAQIDFSGGVWMDFGSPWLDGSNWGAYDPIDNPEGSTYVYIPYSSFSGAFYNISVPIVATVDFASVTATNLFVGSLPNSGYLSPNQFPTLYADSFTNGYSDINHSLAFTLTNTSTCGTCIQAFGDCWGVTANEAAIAPFGYWTSPARPSYASNPIFQSYGEQIMCQFTDAPEDCADSTCCNPTPDPATGDTYSYADEAYPDEASGSCTWTPIVHETCTPVTDTATDISC